MSKTTKRTVKRPGPATTLVARLLKTLNTDRAVLLDEIINGSYYAVISRRGLQLRGHRGPSGWAYWVEPIWVEPMRKNGRA